LFPNQWGDPETRSLAVFFSDKVPCSKHFQQRCQKEHAINSLEFENETQNIVEMDPHEAIQSPEVAQATRLMQLDIIGTCPFLHVLKKERCL
jgi:hypothetical protein